MSEQTPEIQRLGRELAESLAGMGLRHDIYDAVERELLTEDEAKEALAELEQTYPE